MLMSLGGVDAIVFTAGIGEHAPQIRAAACEGMAFLGVALDAAANENAPVGYRYCDCRLCCAGAGD